MIPLATYVVNVITCVTNVLMSPITVAGNALILVAIWKNQSLRTPFYILLGGLAITDFLTGLLTLPFMVASTIVELTNNVTPFFCILTGIFTHGISSYFAFITIFAITFMSVDRWLRMSRSSMMTVKRVYRAYAVISILPIPFIVFRLVQSLDGCISLSVDSAESIVVFLCLLVTTGFYFKVYQIIRHHQHQIHASQPAPSYGQPSIDLAKYKKSITTILYILGLFAICYLPSALFLVVIIFYKNFQFTDEVVIVTKILPTLFFLPSTLNPFLYYYRIRDLRIGVKQLLVNIFQ